MFGGVGLYLDGLFFALIDDDTLFFKTDEATRKRYESAGSKAFCPYPDQPDQSMVTGRCPRKCSRTPTSSPPGRARPWALRSPGRPAGPPGDA
jgi:TfoX/Sxy family transcriptional regulator of competence genes